MNDVRVETIEECAKLAEAMRKEYAEAAEAEDERDGLSNASIEIADKLEHYAEAANEIVKAIRNLKNADIKKERD